MRTRRRGVQAGDDDPEFVAMVAAVEALRATTWPGPGPQPPLAVAHRHPDTGLVTFHLHGLPEQFDFLRAAIAAIACADHTLDPADMTRDQLVAEVLALRGELHQATGQQTGARR
ncbi:hypothetical protein [Actinoplanes sp. G11-F43]|uniref:hypothetical protein n=1 Tax=Actinoplanes sp. G11-F43 TaxID=3424130 RepID=UPI003D33590A